MTPRRPRDTSLTERARRSVVSVKVSPLNKLQWCCTLACGHDVWLTARRKPKTKSLMCERCAP